MKSDPSQGSETPQKSSPLIKICLVGLPVGLIVTSVISFLFFFSKRENHMEAVTSQYAGLFQKDIQASELAKNAEILGKTIGPRDWAHFDNLDSTRSFIDSTMGFNNMGYRVMTQEFLHEQKSMFNLMAELPGKKEPDSIVLVVANYITPQVRPELSDRSVASVFALAQALTGESLDKTVRFVTVANLEGLELRQTGAFYLANDKVYPKEVIQKVFYFEIPEYGEPQISVWKQAAHEAWHVTETADLSSPALDGEAWVARLNDYLLKIREASQVH